MISVMAQYIRYFGRVETEVVCILIQEYTLLAVGDWTPKDSGKTTWL